MQKSGQRPGGLVGTAIALNSRGPMPMRLFCGASVRAGKVGRLAYRRTGRRPMNEKKSETTLSRKQLIDALNSDLSREYQAVIAYVVYSQVLKGAAYMKIAEELEKHASEELA